MALDFLRNVFHVIFACFCIHTQCVQAKGGQHTDQTFETKHTSSDVSITISSDGTYSISAKGIWLQSAPTFFNANNRTYSIKNGNLYLNGSETIDGQDAIGDYQDTGFHYYLGVTMLRVSANIRVYNDYPIIQFYQYFLDDLEGTQGTSVDGLCGGFPGFMLEGPPNLLGYLSYGGSMFGDTNKKMGTWYYQTTDLNDGVKGGPLAIFDRQGNTIVLSPFNNFMSASFLHDASYGGNFYGGIMGGVSRIPSGHMQKFIMYYAPGINKAFEGWGKVLRKVYGKNSAVQKKDFTINNLGYWTDNGAYYYNHTEPNKTYDVTLFDVKSYADQKNIPYRYYQFDSWWYYKGIGDGVKTWTARPDIFPEGFAPVVKYCWENARMHGNITEKLAVPAAANNRYWSADTTYAKENGGRYGFIVEDTKALPLAKEFWLDLFTEAKKWGLITYEQDWLDVQLSGMKALLTNLTLGSDWLTMMAQAAEANGVFIQYTMANPRHAMKALELPAVTQARVSSDYQPGNDQWKIGISSIFAAAMGVAPYKDTFWTTETQPGNKYNKTEPNWKLHSLVSTLSTGSVGPSDMVGGTNRDILMKCCNPSGLILKPQFPARAIDAQIMQAAFGNVGGPEGEVWLSYTEINGLRFGNLLGVDIKNGTQYTVFPEALGIYGRNDTLYAVPYDEPTGWATFSSLYGVTFSDKFKPNRPALYHISPNIPNWFMTTIFGEMDKWVPMSPQRVVGLTWTNQTVTASLQGTPLESFTVWYMMRSKADGVLCNLNSKGAGTLVMNGSLGFVTCEG